MRFIILLFSVFGLAGCILGNLEQLRIISPEANDFESALAAEYLDYALALSEENQSELANYFAAKGMRAWEGEHVPLETVAPEVSNAEALGAARNLLLVLLNEDVKAVVSQQAAHAQLLFDCWVRQEDTGKIADHLCDDDLQAELATLEAVEISLGGGRDIRREIHFKDGSAHLDKAESARLDSLTRQIWPGAVYMVQIENVPADLPQEAKLVKQRVLAIKKALRMRGVSDTHVRMTYPESEKTVYLSGDQVIKSEGVIAVSLHIFHETPEEEKE